MQSFRFRRFDEFYVCNLIRLESDYPPAPVISVDRATGLSNRCKNRKKARAGADGEASGANVKAS